MLRPAHVEPLQNFSKAFAYAFGGHGLYPEEIREMAEPFKWRRVMELTYLTVIPLYWVCGMLGYAAYGDFSKVAS